MPAPPSKLGVVQSRVAPSISLAAAMMLWCGLAVPVLAQSGAPGGFGRAGTVKARVPRSVIPAHLLSGKRDTGELVAEYESFAVVEVPADVAAAIPGAEVLPDENRILLSAGALDTTRPDIKALQVAHAGFKGKALHMVQFAGPVQPAWYDQMARTGVEVVTYIPSNAYIVYGDAGQIAALQALAGERHVQWNGTYRDEYKLHPAATRVMRNHPTATDRFFAIQLVKDPVANAATLAAVNGVKSGEILDSCDVLNYHNIIAPIPPALLATIAARPDVISIQPYIVPVLHDERQDQIVAGNLSGNVPSGAGYLAWLASKGFTQAQFTTSGFAVDVSDSGIDNGSTSPFHMGLFVNGVIPGTSRIIYNRLVGTPHAGSTIQGCDGHGNLNTHIVLGYNNLGAGPHLDASGYHYGLGVCPFTQAGSSVIFDPNTFTSPNYENLQSMAYNNGARISTNSWGASVGGAYTVDSQRYDALVRDAQPVGAVITTPGNQEMVIVFSAGNSGPGANTMGSPGTGKNIFCIGAAENVQAFGGSDGCGIPDTGADSANDIISFSSRGPCADGRKKPDIVAPGTHVSGGVAQIAAPGATGNANLCYTGGGVCGGLSPSIFFPSAGQQFYTASSGTSHSCPAVAGGAALVRQFFINQSMTPPSPAMTKSFLMNSARYMNGVGANDTLFSNNQGMGEMNLGEAFNRGAVTPTFFRDQLAGDMFTATGQTRVFTGNIADATKPFRVTLAWTDAPGPTAGAAFKNNLDLTITAGPNTYKGNVFVGANSTTGGSADAANNVESVFLPAGITGGVTITITATNINSDGVPNNVNPLDQDFALVAYNISAGAPIPTGACCLSASSCTIGTLAACNAAAGSYRGDNTTCPVTSPSGPPQTFVSTNVPVAIPDNTTVNSTLTVAPTFPIFGITANLSITHTFDSDLILTLIAPGGQSVILANRVGGSGDNFTNTTFDDAAATSITAGAAPFTGTFRPSPGTMASLVGVPANGTWTLRVSDNATIDIGSINAWSITITPGPGVTPPCIGPCYANCDNSSIPPILNVGDFACYLNAFAAGNTYANCDNSTVPPILNVGDFACYLNAFAAGCS